MARRICVFAGSGRGARPEYEAGAAALGRLLAERGIGVVYGGGSVGLMGAVADAALAAGGEVIGVIPEALLIPEEVHAGLSEQHVVGSMHERKALMGELSDAFIALPGGLGTLDELLEATTWTQLGFHSKPCGVLNIEAYFDSLSRLLDHAAQEGFLTLPHLQILIVEKDADVLLERLLSWVPPPPRVGAEDPHS
ncbi:MAG: TIGR00730 family Rossman fold protein [Solirubrobacterales bacterium]